MKQITILIILSFILVTNLESVDFQENYNINKDRKHLELLKKEYKSVYIDNFKKYQAAEAKFDFSTAGPKIES